MSKHKIPDIIKCSWYFEVLQLILYIVSCILMALFFKAQFKQQFIFISHYMIVSLWSHQAILFVYYDLHRFLVESKYDRFNGRKHKQWKKVPWYTKKLELITQYQHEHRFQLYIKLMFSCIWLVLILLPSLEIKVFNNFKKTEAI